jgi:hypothetical protein
VLERCWVSIVVLVGFVLAVAWARIAFGPGATESEIARFGYGLPAFEAGRWWGTFTGIPLNFDLTLLPQPVTIVALLLCEWRVGHRRTPVGFLSGQVVAVSLVALFLYFAQDRGSDWLDGLAGTIDVGSSNGAFACLGVWTAFGGAVGRRRWRLAISCYLVCLLLLSGNVYDLTHPVGWITGLVIGGALARRSSRFDHHAFDWAREGPWLVLVLAMATAYGVWDGWAGGGPGGPFGWGPGSPG